MLVLMLLPLLGCARKGNYSIIGSSRAAGADGTVHVETVEGGNRLVVVSMEHLPPPERLSPAMSTYTVWFVPANSYPVKAGNMTFSRRSRQGRIVATTPHKEFVVRLTAEPSKQVNEPGELVVAERHIVH